MCLILLCSIDGEVIFQLVDKLRGLQYVQYCICSFVVLLKKKYVTLYIVFLNEMFSMMENNSFTCSTGFFLPGNTVIPFLSSFPLY